MFSLLETLVDTTKGTSITMHKGNLENVITCLCVMYIKLDMLQIQFKLLNDELRTLQSQK
jgi:hypothetical protein